MWLNVIILSFACLFVGFILGWVVACPRRWDAYINTGPVLKDPAEMADRPPALSS